MTARGGVGTVDRATAEAGAGTRAGAGVGAVTAADGLGVGVCGAVVADVDGVGVAGAGVAGAAAAGGDAGKGFGLSPGCSRTYTSPLLRARVLALCMYQNMPRATPTTSKRIATMRLIGLRFHFHVGGGRRREVERRFAYHG